MIKSHASRPKLLLEEKERKKITCVISVVPSQTERAIFSVVRGSSVRDDEQLMLFISSQEVGR